MRSRVPLIHWIGCASFPLALVLTPGTTTAQDLTPSTEPALTDVSPEPPGLVEEPDLIRRAVVMVDRRFNFGESTDGLYAVAGRMIPGAGWLSGGPGYRRWFQQDRIFTDTFAGVSWRGYKMGQARVELPRLFRSRLLLGSQARWQDFTQVDYFGSGSASLRSNLSEYRVRSKIFGGYATVRPTRSIAIDAQLDWLQPSILTPGGLFERSIPYVGQRFPNDPVFLVDDQPTFLHRELSVTMDTRDFPGHPTAGAVYRAAFSDYRDRSPSLFNFKQYEMEAARFTALGRSGAVLALHGWLMASDPADGQFVPFYLQPSLGGHNNLRGYTDYRFHDRNLLIANAEVRVPLTTHLEAAPFLDLGNVAAELGDVDLKKHSYGLGFRLHTRRQTFARVDIARGGEGGWVLLLRLSDPLDLSRLTRQTATAPFVP